MRNNSFFFSAQGRSQPAVQPHAMTDINLNQLYDKALDVDPDLRFMALEDFKKYLAQSNAVSVKGVERFIPILFHLLKDAHPDVQSQAVKTFGPLTVYITPASTLEMVNKLYELMAAENARDAKKITILIPNMALRSVFTSPVTFLYQLVRQILDSLLPRVLALPVTIDLMELLTYVVRRVGALFTRHELGDMADHMVGIAFSEHGIVSGRAVAVLDLLLGFATEDDADLANRLVQSLAEGSARTLVTLLVLLVLLKNSQHGLALLLTPCLIRLVFGVIDQALQMRELAVQIDPNGFDYDAMVQTCERREEALLTLATLVSAVPFAVFDQYRTQTFGYIGALLRYDPLNFGDDDDAADDLELDIEFSDDEADAAHDDNDDCSWKLRRQLAALVELLCRRYYPHLLPEIYSSFVCSESLLGLLSDRNELVSDQVIATLVVIFETTNEFYAKTSTRHRRHSDASMTMEMDPLVQLDSVLPVLKQQIFDELLVASKASRFPTFFRLVESLAGFKNHEGVLSRQFLAQLDQVLSLASTASVSENLSLYQAILKSSADEVPDELVTRIISDLEACVANRQLYHNVIMESLNTAIMLFRSFRKKLNQATIESMHRELLDKSHNKAYSSELRQRAIVVLSELVYNVSLDPGHVALSMEVIEQNLNYEATVKTTIECTIKVNSAACVNSVSKDVKARLVPRLLQYVKSSDELLPYIALKAVAEVTRDYRPSGLLEDAVATLLNFGKVADMRQLFLIFKILTHLLPNASFVTPEFVKSIVSLVRVKFEGEVDEYDLRDYEHLVKELCVQMAPRDLFNQLYQDLDLTLFISAITLSIVAIEGQLDDVVARSEGELQQQENIVFNLHFLGVITSSMELPGGVNLATFFLFLQPKYSDPIKIASAKAIGLYTIRDVSKFLPLLIKEFEEVDTHRELILVAFKEILINSPDLAEQDIADIWGSIWRQQEGRPAETDINTTESKLVGDILAKVCLVDRKVLAELTSKVDNDALSNSIRYTLIVILKQLLSTSASVLDAVLADDTTATNGDDDALVVEYFVKLLKFFDIVNIPIKQALIGTLLTGLHNMPSMIYPLLQEHILPVVFNELELKEEFRKTIPMGPYKYNIDEGLEIRKLSYEFLYTILSIDVDLSSEYGVRYLQIINNILDKGFRDSESDIVVLSAVNLLTFIKKAPVILNEADVLDKCIDRFKLILGKKLKAKASRQETESFEECRRAILDLCNTIDAFLNRTTGGDYAAKVKVPPRSLQEWNSYLAELKGLYDF